MKQETIEKKSFKKQIEDLRLQVEWKELLYKDYQLTNVLNDIQEKSMAKLAQMGKDAKSQETQETPVIKLNTEDNGGESNN